MAKYSAWISVQGWLCTLWIFSQETMSSTSAVRRVCTASDLFDPLFGSLQGKG
jgi:hypothetical protein